MFQKGDEVRLKKNFYEMDDFKCLSRKQRKDISNQIGKVLTFGCVISGEVERAYYHSDNRGDYTIPVSLLELIKKVDNTDNKPQKGDLFRVIGNKGAGVTHFFKFGSIVTYVRDDKTDAHGLVFEVVDGEGFSQFVCPSDLEPLTPMTDEPHPEIEEGTKFVVIKKMSLLEIGNIVTLVENDNTNMPMFSFGNHTRWLYWKTLSQIEPLKHRYTADQIEEAELVIGKIVAGLSDFDSIFFPTVRDGKTTQAQLNKGIGVSFEGAIAKCSPNDEFNQTIGRMVALCKATDTELPEWIKGGVK